MGKERRLPNGFERMMCKSMKCSTQTLQKSFRLLAARISRQIY